MKKKYFYWFFMLFGVAFGYMPLIFSIAFNQFSGLILVFVFAGTGIFIYGVIDMIKMFKDKRVLKEGKDGIGTFISATCCGSTNGESNYKIQFEYINDNGEVKHVTTSEYFTFDEVEIYRAIERFKITYTDSYAVIKPNQQLAYAKKAVAPNDDHNKENKQKPEEMRTCEYCDTVYSGNKCPYCGAIKKK